MLIPSYSKRQIGFALSHICPECKKMSWSPRYYKRDGTEVSSRKLQLIGAAALISSQSRTELLAVTAECPKCQARWPVFSGGKPRAVPTAPSVQITETHRTEEEFGSEQRRIDNLKSSVELERRLTVTKEWMKSLSIEEERTSTKSTAVQLGLEDIGHVRQASEKALRSKYNVSEDTRETYVEDLLFRVPGRISLVVVLNWKRIWQHGTIRVSWADRTIEVPFRTAVGVTFDQVQMDVQPEEQTNPGQS